MTVSSIASTGGDYSTVQAWEDACPADITAAGTNENWIGEMANEEFNEALTVSGMTTDATHKVILRAASGAGVSDNFVQGTDALRYNSTKAAALLADGTYEILLNKGASVDLDVENIQLKKTGTGGNGIQAGSYTHPINVSGCIIESSKKHEIYRNSGTRSIFSNCAIIGDPTYQIQGRNSDFYFCTFLQLNTSNKIVAGSYGAQNFESCLFVQHGDWQNSTQNHTVDYCVSTYSSWESSTATNSTLNATGSNEIESVTTSASTCDLTLKSGGDADAGGNPITGITTDIFGNARDGSTPDVGCVELVAGGAYTLTSDSGAYTLTGTDAALEVGRKLTADSGSFTFTGSDATLTYSAADPVLSAESGSFTLTGTAATLKHNRKLMADSGTFTFTGTAATLKRGYHVDADSGSFTLTGSDATLTYSPATDFSLSAESGSFALTGSAATLKHNKVLSAASGSFTLTGKNATLTVEALQTPDCFTWSQSEISQYTYGVSTIEIDAHAISQMDGDILYAQSTIDEYEYVISELCACH